MTYFRLLRCLFILCLLGIFSCASTKNQTDNFEANLTKYSSDKSENALILSNLRSWKGYFIVDPKVPRSKIVLLLVDQLSHPASFFKNSIVLKGASNDIGWRVTLPSEIPLYKSIVVSHKSEIVCGFPLMGEESETIGFALAEQQTPKKRHCVKNVCGFAYKADFQKIAYCQGKRCGEYFK